MGVVCKLWKEDENTECADHDDAGWWSLIGQLLRAIEEKITGESHVGKGAYHKLYV